MRLVVDIGNTHLHAALCSDEAVLRQDRFVIRNRGDVGSFLDRFTRRGRSDIEEVGIASVEPRTLEAVVAWMSGLGAPVRIVGRDVPVPLRHEYRDPSRLGIDRLVDAYGVRSRRPGDWIVVNLGTAVTVDAVTADGAFHSGAIVPGIWLALGSLARGAAQLPEIERLDEPARFPTRSTEDAMVSGILIGLAGMIDRIAETLAAEIGIAPNGVATGGDARRVAPHSRVIRDVIPDLTMLAIVDLLRADSPGR
jgi:type III pantothenate kinase